MKDMMIGLAFMSVYGPLVGGYIYYGDYMLEKVADAIYDFLFVKADVKTDGSAGAYLAMFGEAVDA